ncbi:MAG: hypothetical protein WCO23_02660 [bacterium]
MKYFTHVIVPLLVILLLASIFTAATAIKYNKDRITGESTTQNSLTAQNISNLTNINPADFDSIVKNEYSLSSLNAKEVQADNQLSAIDIEVASDLKPSSVTSRYVYSSANDATYNWLMTFTQLSNNFTRMLIPKEDYLGQLTVINTKLWKFNFVTALQIAEKNGGMKWRENNDILGIRLTLRHTEPKNWLLWTIEYKGKEGNLILRIDANSGRVVDEDTPTTIN